MDPQVQLRPMTESDFADYLPHLIVEYAADLIRATGEPETSTRERAADVIARSLPDGRATADNWFFVAVAPGGLRVGQLWLARSRSHPDAAVISDIEVVPDRRGQGFGRAVMVTAEAIAAAKGFSRLDLQVFGFNDAARRLYASLGYRTVSLQMSKPLTQ